MSVTALNYEPFVESSSPRAVAKIGGQVYALEEFDVDLNAHGATSSASFTLPISSNPDFSAQFAGASGTGNASTAEIFVGFPPNPQPGAKPSISGLQRVYSGLIAQYDPKFASDLVTFELRSLASPLVDEKVQYLAQGATTVDFIQRLCSQFGLQLVTALGNKAMTVQAVLGAMYVESYNFAATVHGMRIWDLILQCAQFDNVDVWEDQGTVYYVAPSLVQRQTIDVKYGRDIAIDDGLVGSHALMFSKNITVEARSYQPRVSQSSAVRVITNSDGSVSVTRVQKTTTGTPQFGTPNIVTTTYFPNGSSTTTKTVTGGASGSGFTSQGTESSKERYVFYLKNADAAACNAFAIAQWRKISQQEYVTQMRLPFTQAKGIIPLTSLIRLHNVPYQKFNSNYYPRTIKLSGGVTRAFTYEIDAVNHAPAQNELFGGGPVVSGGSSVGQSGAQSAL